MTTAVATVEPVPELATLTPQERAFAVALAGGANRREAAEAAGYASAAEGQRVIRRADVRAAIRALVARRDAAASLDHESACRLLEAAVLVRVSDLLTYAEDGVTPVGLRPRESLSPAEELRVRRFQAKVHGSAKGQRAHVRWLDVELVPALEVLDRLARLRSWTPDAPAFQILLQSLNVSPTVEAQHHGASLALLHEVAAELLDGKDLDAYLRAFANGDEPKCARLLRDGARELKAVALALPVEASR